MIPVLEIKTQDGYVEAEITKQEEILLRTTDDGDVVAAVILNKQQARWLIDWLSERIGMQPEDTFRKDAERYAILRRWMVVDDYYIKGLPQAQTESDIDRICDQELSEPQLPAEGEKDGR